MPPKHPPKPRDTHPNPQKRKDPPANPHKPDNTARKKHKPNPDHRAKQRDARHLATQTAGKAFSHGVLDVDAFVKAREYEIRALEQGMRRSRGALNRRAFQQVPKELRRRGAAHDVKKVVKRLRRRAGREMVEDRTPTVNGRSRRRKVEGVKRLRVESVKKLRALGAKRKREAEGKKAEGGRGEGDSGRDTNKATRTGKDEDVAKTGITTRSPKIKKATLATPPVPKARFRKRQKHKSWLPTHVFHAKRAHMTPPSAPMWRFSLPLSPTQKSYRMTHRTSAERGAVCWDTSYMGTIALEGEERSVLGMLRALGVAEESLSGAKGKKWRAGTRAMETMVYEREQLRRLIAPVTIIWCGVEAVEEGPAGADGRQKRKLFVKVHPSAFFELWEEVVRLSKVAKPAVRVEDLRFELGSIELTGPGSTEALLAALWPSSSKDQGERDATRIAEDTWTRLAGLTNAAMLPSGATLAFRVQDPKLHFPPRTVRLPTTQDDQNRLLELLADWPLDKSPSPQAIFDRKARSLGSRLPSQKTVNRRKSLAKPGEFPEALDADPQIPLLLYTSTPSAHSNIRHQQSTSWHLLAPWKTIQPLWYSLMYCPLSAGQQPRFGGLNEQRQLAFEAGMPWFPADFPGTKAGWEWEVLQREKRWEEWKKRPKGKRITWEVVRVSEGEGGKGEVGQGWACAWEMLVDPDEAESGEAAATEKTTREAQPAQPTDPTTQEKSGRNKDRLPLPPPRPKNLTHIPADSAVRVLTAPDSLLPSVAINNRLLTVRLTLLTRGVPQTCARIYRLPSDPKLRRAWLALRPSHHPTRKEENRHLPRTAKATPPHIQQQRLAASLFEPPRAGGEEYPLCPGKEDLVGFVTSGNFNLAEGKGTGVGSVVFGMVVEEARRAGEMKEGRLCVVRNAGEGVGRLGRWDVV